MDSNGDSKSSRPQTPSEEDCCNNGCNPCIYDVHRKLLEAYEKRKRDNTKVKTQTNILCLSSYKSFIVSDVRKASENYILLSLKCKDDQILSNAHLLIDPGQYVMLHSWNMTRPYTPISWTSKSIEFLIKLYSDGKFTTRLKNIKIGDTVNIRGPYGDFTYNCNSFQQIIMFSIGSGIAAIYPIAKTIIENELEETKVHLVGGFQKISQIPLKKELQSLSDYWNFKCTMYISQPHHDHFSLHGINLHRDRLNKQTITEILEENVIESTLILICGTQQFVKLAEEWTRDMNYRHIHVFK